MLTHVNGSFEITQLLSYYLILSEVHSHIIADQANVIFVFC